MTTPDTVMIENARTMDAGTVGDILSAFIDDSDWMPRIHTRAQDLAHAARMIDRGWVRVACQSGKVLAFLARENSFIHALYVSPGAQRRGIGAALLEDAKAQIGELDLWTFEANAGACRFYEREGFALVEKGDGSKNDEGLPDRRYVWTASKPSTPKSDDQPKSDDPTQVVKSP